MINDELISRKAVIDRLQKAQNVFLKHSPLEACGISYAREIIASEVEIPTIEKRPQGKWINHRNDYGHNIADCSLCGKAMQWHDEDEDGIPRYCWYCGAAMQKGGAEE